MLAVLYLDLSQWLVIVLFSHLNVVLQTLRQLLNHHVLVLKLSLHLLESHFEVLLVNRMISSLLHELFGDVS